MDAQLPQLVASLAKLQPESSPSIAVGGAVTTADHDAVMRNASARCYPAGSPQLAAVERVAYLSDSNGGVWSATSMLVAPSGPSKSS